MTSAIRDDLSIARFENGDIDGERFDHAAHVYVGWLYVEQFELPTAIARFDAALKRLVVKLGDEDKYHMTLTWFFLLLIAERYEKGESFLDFCRKNSDLTKGSKELLSHYYSTEYIFSSRARERFVLPNNIAMDPA